MTPFFEIDKGAKVTRSTSAYALPLFLHCPENSKQKAPVQGRNNPEFLSLPHSDLPLFGTDWRPWRLTYYYDLLLNENII